MEAMDKRKKDRLIKGIILNAFVFVGCVTYIILLIVPRYESIGEIVTKVNDIMEYTSSLAKDGVNKDSFIELLDRLGKKKEVPAVVFSDPEKLGRAIKKPATFGKDYLSWLVEENGKVNILDKEIQSNDIILGNIIPVFANSPTLNTQSDIDNQITLASFISYVEKDILGKYELMSYAPLGISNITFPEKKDTPVNIGSFKITLDFKGKNSNILSLADALQKSGKLTIRNGKLIPDSNTDSLQSGGKWLSSLSNLLVNIDALSLENMPESPSSENKGSITLEFYVEGMNYQKILVLRSLLSAKFEWLQKSVKEKGLICTKPWNPLCNETATANAIATIKGLLKNLTALAPGISAFKKGDITIDINKEMDTLSDIKASLQSIELTYLKNNSVLEKAKARTK